MKKEQFNKFIKDQKKKGYSDDLIIKHLKDSWKEIESEDIIEDKILAERIINGCRPVYIK